MWKRRGYSLLNLFRMSADRSSVSQSIIQSTYILTSEWRGTGDEIPTRCIHKCACLWNVYMHSYVVAVFKNQGSKRCVCGPRLNAHIRDIESPLPCLPWMSPRAASRGGRSRIKGTLLRNIWLAPSAHV